MMTNVYRCRKAARKTISSKKPDWWRRLGGGEQIKTKGVSKSGWQTVERDEKPGSVKGTGIACQPLFPGETPMRALCTG